MPCQDHWFVIPLDGREFGIGMHLLASAPMASLSRSSRIRWLPRLRPRLPDDAEESLDIDRLGKMVIETGFSESPLVYLLPCGRHGDHANARAPRLITDVPCHLVPILSQQADCYEYPIGPILCACLKCLSSITSNADLAAEQSEKMGKRGRAMPTVVHYQDAVSACRFVHTDSFTPAQLLNPSAFSDLACHEHISGFNGLDLLGALSSDLGQSSPGAGLLFGLPGHLI
jgi:hypothetical protein